MLPKIKIGKAFQKFSLLSKATENWYDFLFYLAGFKDGINVKLKNGISIKLQKQDKSDILNSEKFKAYKALASAYLMSKKGIVRFLNSGFDVLLGGKSLYISFDSCYKFDRFLESLFYLISHPQSFSIEVANEQYLICKIDDCLFKIKPNMLGSLFEIFFERQYPIRVEDKIVIDIGASIGDSTIYFLKQNAKKVIALEPDKESFNILEENLKLNGLYDKTELYNEFADPEKISAILLHQNQSVLKIDCEGCEFEIINNLDEKTLRRAKQIILEYHRFPLSLIFKLKKSGFVLNYADLYIPWRLGILNFLSLLKLKHLKLPDLLLTSSLFISSSVNNRSSF